MSWVMAFIVTSRTAPHNKWGQIIVLAKSIITADAQAAGTKIGATSLSSHPTPQWLEKDPSIPERRLGGSKQTSMQTHDQVCKQWHAPQMGMHRVCKPNEGNAQCKMHVNLLAAERGEGLYNARGSVELPGTNPSRWIFFISLAKEVGTLTCIFPQDQKPSIHCA